MIRVLVFDLGLTLLDGDHKPFPHADLALRDIAKMRCADGQPLRPCLVSDYTHVLPPLTPSRLRPIFDEYLALLDKSGLREHFEPVNRRVTLSTHLGIRKPARKLFKLALKRLKSTATLSQCLLITENPDHTEEVRTRFGMATLQFRSPEAQEFDFDDWAAAPALIAQRLAEP